MGCKRRHPGQQAGTKHQEGKSRPKPGYTSPRTLEPGTATPVGIRKIKQSCCCQFASAPTRNDILDHPAPRERSHGDSCDWLYTHRRSDNTASLEKRCCSCEVSCSHFSGRAGKDQHRSKLCNPKRLPS